MFMPKRKWDRESIFLLSYGPSITMRLPKRGFLSNW